jgi:hypothetical protein
VSTQNTFSQSVIAQLLMLRMTWSMNSLRVLLVNAELSISSIEFLTALGGCPQNGLVMCMVAHV